MYFSCPTLLPNSLTWENEVIRGPSLQNKSGEGPYTVKFFCFINHSFPEPLLRRRILMGAFYHRLVSESRLIANKSALVSPEYPAPVCHSASRRRSTTVCGRWSGRSAGDHQPQDHEDGENKQDGRQGETVGEEPEQAVHGGTQQRPHDHGEGSREASTAARV